ncbi:chloramphenicol phosphotransferase CPT family protein [Vibrio sp. WXL103]|uniref:chloramphenicol phosphotransferase CPT family protein n=1 Tax=unclassified Vibrio TaxID=2614977 RepID=UPI003EC502DE
MAKVIFIHGTSSSGKSTLAKAIQSQIDSPFWHFASDQFVEAGMLPKRVNDGGEFDWRINRPKFFKAFHLCIKAVLDSGNNVILDHIIESDQWYQELKVLLAEHDLFYVGVHCPIEVLRTREIEREDSNIGSRYQGEAEYHLKHVHTYSEYDFEINSHEKSVEENAAEIIEAWLNRTESRFF